MRETQLKELSLWRNCDEQQATFAAATRTTGGYLKQDSQWYDYSFCSVLRRGLDIVFLFSWSNVTVDCASGRGTQNIGLSLQITIKDKSVAAGNQTDVDAKWYIPLHLSRFTPQDAEFDGDGVDVEVVDL